MRITPFVIAIAIAACGRVVTSNDFDAGGNPVPDASPVVEADGGVPGISRNGWTWNNVGPQAADLYGVWAPSSNDVWFVGAAGVILHFDGKTFTAPDSHTSAELRGVWGSSPSDVWAVGRPYWTEGNATILHWDGATWSVFDSPTVSDLYAVWGTSATDAWAVGAKGAALHFDGNAWKQVPTSTTNDLDGVWASGPNDAWAVGSVTPESIDSTIIRWNGNTWLTMPSPSSGIGRFASVSGTSSSDVWLTGDAQIDKTPPGLDPSGYLVHWNGSAWDHETTISPFSTPLRSISGSVAVGSGGAAQMWNGSTWSAKTLPGDFEATFSISATDVWAVGLGGVMAHFDGTSWTELTPPPPVWGEYSAAGVWSNTPSDAWVVGNGATNAVIEHWDGHAWTQSTISAASPNWIYFYGVWGTSATDMWAFGGGPTPDSARIVHFDGSAWSVAYDVQKTYWFMAAWGAAKDDVWFAGDTGALVHWDGTTMTPMNITTEDSFYAVRGTSAKDIWMAGSTNETLTMRHWDGTSWTSNWTDEAGLITSLYVASSNDVWGVGWEGAAVHFDGTMWSQPKLPREVGSIWGSSGSDIWAVGYFGSVVHYDGTAWSEVAITESSLAGVAGSSASDVWMVTSAGAILHHP